MFCPNCGKELKPADWYYDRKGEWECTCGTIIKEEWDFEKKQWKRKVIH